MTSWVVSIIIVLETQLGGLKAINPRMELQVLCLSYRRILGNEGASYCNKGFSTCVYIYIYVCKHYSMVQYHHINDSLNSFEGVLYRGQGLGSKLLTGGLYRGLHR